jgi:Spy/CpxP family protein refolding chaperone
MPSQLFIFIIMNFYLINNLLKHPLYLSIKNKTMKKLIFTAIAISAFTIVTNAQTMPDNKSSNDEKAMMKAKFDEQLNENIKELGLTDEQGNQVKDVMKDASKRSSELKKDTSLNEEAKATKKEEINNEKNDKLKQIMGSEKYKQWNLIRKKQKEQNMPASPEPASPAPANNEKPQ